MMAIMNDDSEYDDYNHNDINMIFVCLYIDVSTTSFIYAFKIIILIYQI